jgi:cholesterol oxidase
MADERIGSSSRRDFLKAGTALVAASLAVTTEECAPVLWPGRPFSGVPDPYHVIIIGTGFGATVAATEVVTAFPQAKVLMLERGLFFSSQERPYPAYLQDPKLAPLVQNWPAPDNDHGFLNGFLPYVRTNLTRSERVTPGQAPLYRYSIFDDVDILTASGVGGGSLIYSNVSLEPYYDPSSQSHPVMQDWPSQLTTKDYDRARVWMETFRDRMNRVVTTVPVEATLKPYLTNLDAVPGPNNSKVDYQYLYLPRSRAFRTASQKVSLSESVTKKTDWEPLDLQVFEHGGTDPSVLKGARFCERQGRCFLGCLPAARHTLNKTIINKLLSRPNSKLTLRPLSHVQQVRTAINGYEVIYHDAASGDEFRATAALVIVAAGVLGSTEILLRSRDLPLEGKGQLVMSDTLGSRFSTNGDFSGFVRGIPRALNDANGKPTIDNRVFPTRGPINTSHVTYQAGRLLVNVEDAGIPPMFAAVSRRILDAMDHGKISFGKLIQSGLDTSLLGQTEHEMVQDVFWFNCMGTDGIPGKPAAETLGRFSLSDDGRLRLTYAHGSTPTSHPVFQQIEDILKAYAQAMQGTYVPFPLWGGLFGNKKLVVTHPLGGCPMGNSSTDGVVDTEGRLFNTRSGASSTYPGLYVMDGSILPGAVAVNPTLTIVALSLKIADSVGRVLQNVPTFL